MKKTGSLYCITAGNPKKVIKPVVWTVLADLVNLFPFGLLTLAVSSIYPVSYTHLGTLVFSENLL